MRTKKNFRNPRTKRAKRELRRLSDLPSLRTLKSLKNLSYRDLKALSSEQLQKYKRGLHIVDPEGNPYTDEALRKKLRPYISARSKKKFSYPRHKQMPSTELTKAQKRAFHQHLIKKYGWRFVGEDNDPVLGEEYRKFRANPEEVLEGIKNKKGGGKSAYFEFKKGPSKKFWRIVKDGSKLTTHYGRIGSLGQTTKKYYGSDVDEEYEKLIQSKKKKGYVEKTDYGVSNRATSIEREYMKVCRKAEKSKVLNPNQVKC